MPAPAIYVLAIVGTVGAVIAFKEFVYEPHIAPAIDRWKAEYQAARHRRRMAAIHQAQAEVQMTQTQKKEPKPRASDKFSDEDNSDDDDDDSGHGKGSSTASSKFMKGGLLLRRPEWDVQNQRDVELDNFVAREVSEWRSEVTGQVLRQRKNVSEHAMDESIHAIPYVPLSPSRTHVVFDPSSPSTPSAGSRVPSPPPPPPVLAPPTGVSTTGPSPTIEPQVRSSSAAPVAREEPVDPIQSVVSVSVPVSSPVSSILASPASPMIHPPAEAMISPTSPEVTPFQHAITQSTLLDSTSDLSPTFNIPSSSNVSAEFDPLQQSYPQVVPSLSQSYPQELDYEHGLELLSPPSSRSASPFSMAGMSPNQDQGQRALSPFSSIGSRSTSTFSSAVSSPSPLRMNLSNQSFDAVSPIVQPHPISPFLDPPAQQAESTSITNSARSSTTYLSFDNFSDDGADEDHDQPYGNLGASIGVEGAGAGDPSYFRPSSAAGAGSSSYFTVHDAGAGAARAHTPMQSDGELSDLDFMSDYTPSESDLGNESDSSWSMAGGSHAGGSAAGSPRMGAGVNLTRGGTVRDARGDRSRWA
ncbi:hypothetical protein BDZ97DRAFT_1755920 [Flammula alnicola]|nr:hypothetical protein BDZ97DRAFT_1755920 [Flammula alnicola]